MSALVKSAATALGLGQARPLSTYAPPTGGVKAGQVTFGGVARPVPQRTLPTARPGLAVTKPISAGPAILNSLAVTRTITSGPAVLGSLAGGTTPARTQLTPTQLTPATAKQLSTILGIAPPAPPAPAPSAQAAAPAAPKPATPKPPPKPAAPKPTTAEREQAARANRLKSLTGGKGPRSRLATILNAGGIRGIEDQDSLSRRLL